MRVFLFSDDLAGRGDVWLNILWPMYQVYASCFDTTYLPIPPDQKKVKSHLAAKIALRKSIIEHRKQLCDSVNKNLSINEPNVLIVWAASARNVLWTRALDQVWDKFDHHVLHVCDTMQPNHCPLVLLDRFDLITCFCADLAREFETVLGARTLFWPAHLDTLNYHSESDYRPIDLCVVGRRRLELHEPLHRHFNQPGKETFYLDFVTRTQPVAPSCEQQFHSLMATYSRSSVSFCYEPGYVPRFKARSPLLSRWVHAWASGCTVLGKRPTGTGTADLMDWEDSVIDLPDDPVEAITEVEAILKDTDAMRERRHRNVLEAIRRHDTRTRIALTLDALGLEKTASFADELERLEALEDEVLRAQSGSCSSDTSAASP